MISSLNEKLPTRGAFIPVTMLVCVASIPVKRELQLFGRGKGEARAKNVTKWREEIDGFFFNHRVCWQAFSHFPPLPPQPSHSFVHPKWMLARQAVTMPWSQPTQLLLSHIDLPCIAFKRSKTVLIFPREMLFTRKGVADKDSTYEHSELWVPCASEELKCFKF